MSPSKGKEINPIYCTSIVHHSIALKTVPPEPKTLKLRLNRFDFPQRSRFHVELFSEIFTEDFYPKNLR